MDGCSLLVCYPFPLPMYVRAHIHTIHRIDDLDGELAAYPWAEPGECGHCKVCVCMCVCAEREGVGGGMF